MEEATMTQAVSLQSAEKFMQEVRRKTRPSGSVRS